MTPLFGAVAISVFLLPLLVADYHQKLKLAAYCKIAASTALLIYALWLYWQNQGALSSSPVAAYPHWLLAGVAFGVLGDWLLVGKSKRSFLLGMAAFLLGHLCYLTAFWQLFFKPSLWLLAWLAIGLAMLWVYRWIRAELKGIMRPAVAIYMVFLALMASLALVVEQGSEFPWIGLGGWLFMLSDFFVAQHRFKTPKFYDRLIGLPLYYAGQYCLVTSLLWVV